MLCTGIPVAQPKTKYYFEESRFLIIALENRLDNENVNQRQLIALMEQFTGAITHENAMVHRGQNLKLLRGILTCHMQKGNNDRKGLQLHIVNSLCCSQDVPKN